MAEKTLLVAFCLCFKFTEKTTPRKASKHFDGFHRFIFYFSWIIFHFVVKGFFIIDRVFLNCFWMQFINPINCNISTNNILSWSCHIENHAWGRLHLIVSICSVWFFVMSLCRRLFTLVFTVSNENIRTEWWT